MFSSFFFYLFFRIWQSHVTSTCDEPILSFFWFLELDRILIPISSASSLLLHRFSHTTAATSSRKSGDSLHSARVKRDASTFHARVFHNPLYGRLKLGVLCLSNPSLLKSSLSS